MARKDHGIGIPVPQRLRRASLLMLGVTDIH